MARCSSRSTNDASVQNLISCSRQWFKQRYALLTNVRSSDDEHSEISEIILWEQNRYHYFDEMKIYFRKRLKSESFVGSTEWIHGGEINETKDRLVITCK